MIIVSITRLRRELFKLIEKASKGETIIVKRKGDEMVSIIPIKKQNWRSRTKHKPRLKTTPEEAFAPLEDVWEDYF